MDRLIEVKINGHHLSKDNNVAGVQHESNATVLRIEFDPTWDGLAKKVTFWDARGLNPVERILTTDLLEDMAQSTRIYLCPIPGEAMAEAGRLEFVVDGWKDGVRPRSLSAQLTVKPAPKADNAGQPEDPTPSMAEQLQGQVDAMMGELQVAVTAKEDARASAEEAAASAANIKASEDAAKASAEAAAASAGEAAASADEAASSVAGSVEAAIANRQMAEEAAANAKASQEKFSSNYGNVLWATQGLAGISSVGLGGGILSLAWRSRKEGVTPTPALTDEVLHRSRGVQALTGKRVNQGDAAVVP